MAPPSFAGNLKVPLVNDLLKWACGSADCCNQDSQEIRINGLKEIYTSLLLFLYH